MSKISTRKVASKKSFTKQAKSAAVIVGFAQGVDKLHGYTTHASYVNKQQRAYKVLAATRARELNSVSNILRALAAK